MGNAHKNNPKSENNTHKLYMTSIMAPSNIRLSGGREKSHPHINKHKDHLAILIQINSGHRYSGFTILIILPPPKHNLL